MASYLKIRGLKQKSNSYKKVRKSNYKKKVKQEDECCICFEMVPKCSDNTIHCGKTPHIICGACKVQMKGENCPMCRSHPLRMPVAQDVNLPLVKRFEKPWSHNPVDFSRASRKQRRKYQRSGPYFEDFGPQTNRLVRQIKNSQGLTARNYILEQSTSYPEWLRRCGGIWQHDTSRYASVRETNSEEQWLTEEQVLRYNGSLRTEYDSEASDESEDSSSDDTLSLTSSVSEGTIVRVLFEDSD